MEGALKTREGQSCATTVSELSLVLLEALRPGRVTRWGVTAGPPSYPATVIARTAGEDPDHGGRDGLLNELASLSFLERCCPGLTPRAVTFDLDHAVLLVEDIVGPTIADLLARDDVPAVVAALSSFALVLGRMHRETTGRAEEFYAVRRSLGPIDERKGRLFLRTQDLRTSHEETRRIALTHGLPPWSKEVVEEFDGVLGTLAEPGDYLAFSNGDPCLDNVIAAERGAVLVDFEVGTFRHRLLDAAYFTVPFPNCWCWSSVPHAVGLALLNVYRAAFCTPPSPTETARFDAEYAMCQAAWVVHLVGARFDRIVGEYRDLGLVSEQQRMITVLERFGDDPTACKTIPALTTWAAEVAVELRRRWCANPGVHVMTEDGDITKTET